MYRKTATDFENFKKVIELAMNISADGHRGSDGYHIFFFH